MSAPTFYIGGHGEALHFAKAALLQQGFTFSEMPDNSVTHLLLGSPAFEADGKLKGGGRLEDILPAFNKNIHILGGNLTCPLLQNYHTIDFLKDPSYLAENANITAYCALKVATNHIQTIWKGLPVLVIGWGRIGKCLSRLLKALDADVSVGLRNPSDTAILNALGCDTLDSSCFGEELSRYRVIFNTVPAVVIPKEIAAYCQKNCIKIELASKPGILDSGVIDARGLPNKEAPETSGDLIARTVLRRYQEGV